jgi:hypothetical protein
MLRASGHAASQVLEMRQCGVPAAAVGVDEDGVGPVDPVGRRPLAVERHIDVDKLGSALAQALGEEEYPGVVLVVARTVARAAGDEEDITLLGSA